MLRKLSVPANVLVEHGVDEVTGRVTMPHGTDGVPARDGPVGDIQIISHPAGHWEIER